MSKMSDMAATIEELRKCAAAINDAANWLVEVFSGTTETTEEVPEPVPVEKPLTLEEVRAVLARKSRAGHTAEVKALLQKFGVEKLSQIDASNYKALLADAEGLDDAT